MQSNIDNQRPLAGDCIATRTFREGTVEYWQNAQTEGVEPFLRLDLVDGRLPRYRVMVMAYGRAAVEEVDEEIADDDEPLSWSEWVAISLLFLFMGSWWAVLWWVWSRLLGGN